jgi:hypothetical protein
MCAAHYLCGLTELFELGWGVLLDGWLDDAKHTCWNGLDLHPKLMALLLLLLPNACPDCCCCKECLP